MITHCILYNLTHHSPWSIATSTTAMLQSVQKGSLLQTGCIGEQDSMNDELLLAWANHSTCLFVAYSCTMVPLGTFAGQRARAFPLGHWAAFLLHTTTCPESRIRHPYTHEKHGVYFCKSGKLCGVLLGCSELSSTYPLMTLPVWCPVIRHSFASIADTLREEFANKGWRLYENIYNI